MRHYLAAVLAVVLAASPVIAQNQDQTQVPAQVPAQDPVGRSLMERGAELFFEGLRNEMSPALEDFRGMAEQFGPAMRGFVAEMGPAFAELLGEVKDWSNYHPPEILPNGDIIIRRKADPKDKVDEGADSPDSTDI